MRLKSQDLIFGIIAKDMRAFLRKCSYGNFRTDFFKKELKLEKENADKILDQMIKEEYFEKDKTDNNYLNIKTKANAIRNAKFIKPITKVVAEKYVQELIERAKKINEDEYFIVNVDKIYAFGSYISDSEDCGDIDLVVELKNKQDFSIDELNKINHQRCPPGKGIFEQLTWASSIEPLTFLKNKNKYLGFHEKKDAESVATLKLIWERQ